MIPIINIGDPTRTATLRTRFANAIVRRMRELLRDITISIVDNDVFGIAESRPMTLAPARPQQFAFRTNPSKIDAFMDWLNEQQAQGLLKRVPTPFGSVLGPDQPWSNEFIESAYKQGILRGKAELKRQGITETFAQLPGADPLSLSLASPIHSDSVAFLYTRVFRELEGVTRAMDTIISRTLSQGLIDGQSPRVIARELSRATEIALSRARTIARTEIVRAHHLANINEYQLAGVEGVTVKAEWSTAGDLRVCQRCKALEGKIFKLDVIRGMIPLHPNCRCAAIPVVIQRPTRRHALAV